MIRSADVEVVAIGTELLLGHTLDSNGAWLGRRLASRGIRVVRRSVVGDDAGAIRTAVADALQRTGTVICSGGLGPTRDDITKHAIATLYGRSLQRDEHWLDELRKRYRARAIPMPAANESQAMVPEGAVFFANAHGTAPGLALEDERGITIMLPGVPHEFRGLAEDHIILWLESRLPERTGPIRSRVLRTTGIPESALGERIDDLVDDIAPLTIAFLPSFAGTDLRVTSWNLPLDQAESSLDHAEAKLRERLGVLIYAADEVDLAEVVGTALSDRQLTIAVAESCTGGLVAKRLTDAPGSSAYLHASIVAYSNDAKVQFLRVSEETIRSFGAVSEQTAREMLLGVRAAVASDCSIAVTGIAGPGGGTAEKPVGTVWIGAATPDGYDVRHLYMRGDRTEIRERSAQAALDLLRRLLLQDAS